MVALDDDLVSRPDLHDALVEGVGHAGHEVLDVIQPEQLRDIVAPRALGRRLAIVGGL